MVVKLYVDYLSQPCRAIALLLKANNFAFTEEIVDLVKGEHKTEKYAKINPQQSVPTLEEDGWILTESVAILKYLSSKSEIAESWYPRDPKARARVDEYLSWQHTGLRKGAVPYFVSNVFGLMMSGKPIEAEKLKEVSEGLENVLDTIEKFFLKDNKFLAGNTITIADLLGICEIMQPISIKYDVSKGRPKLGAWIDRTKAALQPHFDDINTVLFTIAEGHESRVKALK